MFTSDYEQSDPLMQSLGTEMTGKKKTLHQFLTFSTDYTTLTSHSSFVLFLTKDGENTAGMTSDL